MSRGPFPAHARVFFCVHCGRMRRAAGRATCCELTPPPPWRALPTATCAGCGCRCTINGKPRGEPHPVHSCCLIGA